MDFPTYVPVAARVQITTLISGSPQWPVGLVTSVDNDNSHLEYLDHEIATMIRNGQTEGLDELRRQRVELAESRDESVGEADCLRRLAHDPRMQAAYALLTGEFNRDGQWCNFINSACHGRWDFTKHRDGRKRADELRAEIAEAAERLAKVLRQMAETGIEMPAEFFSISELLQRTESNEKDEDNAQEWRAMRQHVLGGLQGESALASDSMGEIGLLLEPQHKYAVRHPGLGERVWILPKEDAQNVLSDVWESAPYLTELLGTVAEAARNFKPRRYGMVGAAIESRQKNRKTEYLRAFGFMLAVHRLPDWQIALTTPVMRAIAITANVAMNLPDVDVTYDDVRKILPMLHEVLVRDVNPAHCSLLRSE